MPNLLFREDERPTRAGHAGAGAGLLRVSQLKRDGTKGRPQRWNDDYLLKVLQALTHCYWV